MQSLCVPPLHFPATALRLRRYPKSAARSVRAELREENDPLIQSAIDSASLRLRETNRTGNLSLSLISHLLVKFDNCVFTYSYASRRTHYQSPYCLIKQFLEEN